MDATLRSSKYFEATPLKVPGTPRKALKPLLPGDLQAPPRLRPGLIKSATVVADIPHAAACPNLCPKPRNRAKLYHFWRTLSQPTKSWPSQQVWSSNVVSGTRKHQLQHQFECQSAVDQIQKHQILPKCDERVVLSPGD